MSVKKKKINNNKKNNNNNKKNRMANSVDPDEIVYYELSHLDLHCL